MLVLSRKIDETIIIGPIDIDGKPEMISVMLVAIQGDKVRLGITAPRSVDIHRKEVFRAIQLQREEAAKINESNGT